MLRLVLAALTLTGALSAPPAIAQAPDRQDLALETGGADAATADEGEITRTPGADAAEDVAMPQEPEAEPEGLRIIEAGEVTIEEFLWEHRLLVVFADTPANPAFQQQMRQIEDVADGLLERDIVVIIDTDPAARSAARLRLRPRGFSLVLVERDGTVVQRKPQPWTGRAIIHAIDRLPLRRQEMLEERPSGR